MDDTEFLAFLEAQSTKGGAVCNFQKGTLTKGAVTILEKTPYKALAKAHINASVQNAYHNNAEFAQKFDAVMAEYNITVIQKSDTDADADADAEADA